MIRSFTTALGLACAATAGLADEVWDTDEGLAVYEADLDSGEAVISVPFQGESIRVYVPTLAGNFDNRYTHAGYWIGTDPAGCSATITAPDGVEGNAWGQAVIAFDERAFPTGWTLLIGTCFDPPGIGIRGDVPPS